MQKHIIDANPYRSSKIWASPILAPLAAAGLSNECLLLGFPVLLEGLA
jgi:hypothetical protein